MRSIENVARLKRFQLKSDQKLQLVIETMVGSRVELEVINASVQGIAACVAQEQTKHPELEEGELIPEAKLEWQDNECALGRLSVARLGDWQGRPLVAFTCIDAKIPLSGSLAALFETIDRGHAQAGEFEICADKFSLADFTEAEFSHPDLFERCRQYQTLLKDQRQNPLFQYYTTRKPVDGLRQEFRLAGSGKQIRAVTFASYDYLGYSNREEVKRAACDAIMKYGVSSKGSLILYGKTEIHEHLESRIASMFRKEDCLLFSSGFATNVGTLSGLLRPNDLVVADFTSHASIQDGMAASKARCRLFRHNDFESLDSVLKRHRKDARGALVVTEGLFSMDGTTPNLREFVAIAERHNARTFVDECHSIGVFGPNRLGIADRDGVLDDIDVYMGSFSKGLGIGGCGFIVGDRAMIEWLRFFGRAGMFSGALPPAMAAAALAVTDIMQNDDIALERLKRNVRHFHSGLMEMGVHTTAQKDSPIVPVIISDEKKLGIMNQTLLENNIYTNCILYPAVPQGQSRFRFSLNADHSLSDLDLCLLALKQAFEKAGVDPASTNPHEIDGIQKKAS